MNNVQQTTLVFSIRPFTSSESGLLQLKVTYVTVGLCSHPTLHIYAFVPFPMLLTDDKLCHFKELVRLTTKKSRREKRRIKRERENQEFSKRKAHFPLEISLCLTALFAVWVPPELPNSGMILKPLL